MVRVAVLDESNYITIVYEKEHFLSLGLDKTTTFVEDFEYKAFMGGQYVNGVFIDPPICDTCFTLTED